jgi:hypothetical protein
MDFFFGVVAPVISGPLKSEFWTHVVRQVSPADPAVRHAVVAVSALYESLGQPEDKHRFALAQYNRAIRRLYEAPDETTVLVVCVLMVCLEFLLGNAQAAVVHCQHGVTLLNGSSVPPSVRDSLVPLFSRLSIFPFLFGSSPATSPLVDVHRTTEPPKTPKSLTELQEWLDMFHPRILGFMGDAEAYKAGDTTSDTATILTRQQEVSQQLSKWHDALTIFRQNHPPPPTDTLTNYILEMRYLVGSIWIATALATDEHVYDAYLPAFQRIVELGTLALSSRPFITRGPAEPPKFLFEIGYVPLLQYVVLQCRDLPTRVAALQVLRALGVARENLYDTDVMYAAGRAVIETEHGVRLADVPLLYPEASEETAARAAEWLRQTGLITCGDGREMKRFTFSGPAMSTVMKQHEVVLR